MEYKQEFYHKLHTLKQERKTVGEYIKDFEAYKIRCDLPEEKEHTIVRFIGRLNKEIPNVVELQQYKTLDDVYKLALKVEKQKEQLKMTSFRPFPRVDASSRGGMNVPISESSRLNAPSITLERKKAEEPKREEVYKPNVPRVDKTKAKCFKCHGIGHFQVECPNNKVMTI